MLCCLDLKLLGEQFAVYSVSFSLVLIVSDDCIVSIENVHRNAAFITTVAHFFPFVPHQGFSVRFLFLLRIPKNFCDF